MVSCLCFFLLTSVIQLSHADVHRTMNDLDLANTNYCMDNKHPFKPSTFSCEDYFMGHISSQLSTINQMSDKLNSTYVPSSSLYPIFPAVSTGIFNLIGTFPYNTQYLPRYAAFGTLVGSQVGCWRPYTSDLNQQLYIGSSVPFMFHKIVLAGSGSSSMWVKSFRIQKVLDPTIWFVTIGTYTSNTDDNSLFELEFEPFLARAILIEPLTWQTAIALRVEVYVSKPDIYYQKLQGLSFNSVRFGFHYLISHALSESYGQDYLHTLSGPPNGESMRLCLNSGEYVIVSSGHMMKMHRIFIMNDSATPTERVEYIKIHYTTDGVEWISYLNGASLTVINGGNYGHNPSPDILAISIKINFYNSYTLCCLRIEVDVSEAY